MLSSERRHERKKGSRETVGKLVIIAVQRLQSVYLQMAGSDLK